MHLGIPEEISGLRQDVTVKRKNNMAKKTGFIFSRVMHREKNRCIRRISFQLRFYIFLLSLFVSLTFLE